MTGVVHFNLGLLLFVLRHVIDGRGCQPIDGRSHFFAGLEFSNFSFQFQSVKLGIVHFLEQLGTQDRGVYEASGDAILEDAIKLQVLDLTGDGKAFTALGKVQNTLIWSLRLHEKIVDPYWQRMFVIEEVDEHALVGLRFRRYNWNYRERAEVDGEHFLESLIETSKKSGDLNFVIPL